ncbi:MAG: TMEM175 family protein [Pseudomonadota bacterium]
MLTRESLAELPIKDGFRQRGMDMTRLETFIDAAFAFAVTLLVVGGGDSTPINFSEMTLAMKQVPAFAACFANIMLFWYAHHVWSRRFGLDDLPTVLLSLMMIFVILVYVYPLKAIYSGAIEFFSDGLLPSNFSMQSAEDLRAMFTIFSTGYFALAALMACLNRHALRVGDALLLSDAEAFGTKTEEITWWIHVGLAVLSIALAQFMPDHLIVLAGVCYALLGVLIPLNAHLRLKQSGSSD